MSELEKAFAKTMEQNKYEELVSKAVAHLMYATIATPEEFETFRKQLAIYGIGLKPFAMLVDFLDLFCSGYTFCEDCEHSPPAWSWVKNMCKYCGSDTVILRISDEELAEFKERWVYRSDPDDD